MEVLLSSLLSGLYFTRSTLCLRAQYLNDLWLCANKICMIFFNFLSLLIHLSRVFSWQLSRSQNSPRGLLLWFSVPDCSLSSRTQASNERAPRLLGSPGHDGLMGSTSGRVGVQGDTPSSPPEVTVNGLRPRIYGASFRYQACDSSCCASRIFWWVLHFITLIRIFTKS